MNLKTKFYSIFATLTLLIFVLFMVILLSIVGRLMWQNVLKELNNISQALVYLTKNYYDQYEIRADYDISLAENLFSGEIRTHENIQNKITVENQYTGRQFSTRIPAFTLDGVLYTNRNDVVDRFRRITGDHLSLLQLDPLGLIRVSTTLRNNGERITGLMIPRVSPIAQSIADERKPYRMIEKISFVDETNSYLTVSKPLYFDDGKRIFGAVKISIEMEGINQIEEQILRMRSGEKGFSYIINTHGYVVAHPHYEKNINIYKQKDIDGKQYIREMCHSKEGEITYRINKDGKILKLTAIYKYFPEMNWILVTAYDHSEFKQSILEAVKNVMFGLFALSILVYLMIRGFVNRFLINNLNRLMKGIQILNHRVNHQDLKEFKEMFSDETLNIHSKDEIEDLASSFTKMAKKLITSYEKIEDKNREIKNYSNNLEEMVKERTSQLDKSNHELSHINTQMRKELSMAQRIQDAVIPKFFPEFSNVEISGMYFPMEDLGGDFYDVYKIDETHMGVVIADVSGHGISAALITMIAKLSFTNNSRPGKSAGEIMNLVNKELFGVLEDILNYLTVFYGIIDLERRELEYCSAGHVDIYHLKKDGGFDILESTTTFVGVMKDLNFPVKRVKLKSSEKLIFYTDGVVEARNNQNEFYGEERFTEVISQNKDLPAKRMIWELISDIQDFKQGRPSDDDLTLLIVDLPFGFGIREFKMNVQPIEKNTIVDNDVLKMILNMNQVFYRVYQMYQEKQYEFAEDLIMKRLYKKYRRKEDNHRVLDILGHIYFNMGRYQDAVKAWEEAKEYYPYDRNLNQNLDLLIREIGKS